MRELGRVFRMITAAALMPLAAAAATPAEGLKLNFTFDGKDAARGWGQTKAIAVTPLGDGLELNGRGWDAKIWRRIELPAGYYLITASGKGKSLQVQLAKGFESSKVIFDMNLSRNDWRTDWRPLRLEKPEQLLLIVRASAAQPVKSVIRYIRIEAAHEEKEDGIPPVTELEKQRPHPYPVRGCTMSQGRDADGLDKKFAALKPWHANAVRLFMGGMSRENWLDDPAAFNEVMTRVEQYLRTARRYGMKAVLTVNGGVFGVGKKPTSNAFWTDPALPGKVCDGWRRIAERLLPYRDAIYGYDLYNEPLDWGQMPNPPRQWRDIAKAAIKAIRSVDRQTWIIYEPGPGGMHWGFAGMKPLPDTRVIYSLHFYSPHEFTHQGIYNLKNTDLAEVKAKLNVRYPGEVNGFLWNKESIRKSLAPVCEFQRQYRVPILVGEFSVIRWAPKDSARQYLADLIDIFEDNHWGWVYHAFREWPGWSVEHDETWAPHQGPHHPATGETERAKVLKQGLNRNLP